MGKTTPRRDSTNMTDLWLDEFNWVEIQALKIPG